jgi:hypothetical protein
VSRDDKVYFKVLCLQHGMHELLVCSSLSFYTQIMSFDDHKHTTTGKEVASHTHTHKHAKAQSRYVCMCVCLYTCH